ncbi:MAG: 1-aminocyclopropane-1-carboxylate deaminase/D-cysteine desulfhydrase [Bacteroidia bacterium]
MGEFNFPIQSITVNGQTKIDVLRLDLIHPLYGGNKCFKLKYNIEDFKHSRKKAVLTFGGAHSNHIYSTAAYCYENSIPVIGVIRGEEEMESQSPTLQFSVKHNMQLIFVSREAYSKKEQKDFLERLNLREDEIYVIPEGGNNELGIKGCQEMIPKDSDYDFVFCACGTACTYSGILASVDNTTKVIGISVLKGDNQLIEDVNANLSKIGRKVFPDVEGHLNQSTILNSYHFGGYARHTNELIEFKSKFETRYNMPLDYVYTSKLFYAVFNLIENNKIPANSRVAVIHSGGQQGNEGYERRYKINA